MTRWKKSFARISSIALLAGVVLAMLLLGLMATWIPALRALRADPLALLREE
jgi:ABC-type lipoprotein release transport system permease subunit